MFNGYIRTHGVVQREASIMRSEAHTAKLKRNRTLKDAAAIARRVGQLCDITKHDVGTHAGWVGERIAKEIETLMEEERPDSE